MKEKKWYIWCREMF